MVAIRFEDDFLLLSSPLVDDCTAQQLDNPNVKSAKKLPLKIPANLPLKRRMEHNRV